MPAVALPQPQQLCAACRLCRFMDTSRWAPAGSRSKSVVMASRPPDHERPSRNREIAPTKMVWTPDKSSSVASNVCLVSPPRPSDPYVKLDSPFSIGLSLPK